MQISRRSLLYYMYKAALCWCGLFHWTFHLLCLSTLALCHPTSRCCDYSMYTIFCLLHLQITWVACDLRLWQSPNFFVGIFLIQDRNSVYLWSACHTASWMSVLGVCYMYNVLKGMDHHPLVWCLVSRPELLLKTEVNRRFLGSYSTV